MLDITLHLHIDPDKYRSYGPDTLVLRKRNYLTRVIVRGHPLPTPEQLHVPAVEERVSIYTHR